MLNKYNLLLVLMLVAVAGKAQNSPPKNIFLKTLSNGLQVVIVEDHTVPLVSMMMTFKAGSFTETDANNGLTSLYQLMLFKGNKDHEDEQAFNYYSGGLGIRLMNSLASMEYATSYLTLPKANFEPGLNFLNSAIRYAKLDPEELEKEKINYNIELKRKESNPFYALSTEMDKHLWGASVSRKTPLGKPEVISAATPDALRALKNKYYYPNNAILIIGGDIEHDDAFAEIDRIFGDWVSAEIDPMMKWPVADIKPLVKTDNFIVESKFATEPSLSISWHGPDTRTDVEATYAADVFLYIINQNASKLKKALLESGLATSVRISYLTSKYVGPITLTISPARDKIKECVAEVKKQIALMANDDYVSIEQIQTAKRMLAITKVREEEITTDYLHSISFWWTAISLEYLWDYNDNLNKVTPADIKAYVHKYIVNKPYCAGLLISPELNAQVNASSFFTTTK